MPTKSKAQFRAMQAAAHGRSTLGIPKQREAMEKKSPMLAYKGKNLRNHPHKRGVPFKPDSSLVSFTLR